MNNDIKEIISMSADEDIEIKYINEKGAYVYKNIDIYELLDYITNLQEENEILKKIAHKMHLWIFLHTGDEQKVYDELGLTDEENAMLGYSGQFRIGSDEDVKD